MLYVMYDLEELYLQLLQFALYNTDVTRVIRAFSHYILLSRKPGVKLFQKIYKRCTIKREQFSVKMDTA